MADLGLKHSIQLEKIEKRVKILEELTNKRGGELMKKVKIFCHCCEGRKKITEKAYPDSKDINVTCPECNGEGWVWA